MLYNTVFTQDYISLIHMIRRWNKYPTLYFRFPLVNHGLNIKQVTRDNAENYVSTFVILQTCWLLKQIRKIYQT